MKKYDCLLPHGNYVNGQYSWLLLHRILITIMAPACSAYIFCNSCYRIKTGLVCMLIQPGNAHGLVYISSQPAVVLYYLIAASPFPKLCLANPSLMFMKCLLTYEQAIVENVFDKKFQPNYQKLPTSFIMYPSILFQQSLMPDLYLLNCQPCNTLEAIKERNHHLYACKIMYWIHKTCMLIY